MNVQLVRVYNIIFTPFFSAYAFGIRFLHSLVKSFNIGSYQFQGSYSSVLHLFSALVMYVYITGRMLKNPLVNLQSLCHQKYICQEEWFISM